MCLSLFRHEVILVRRKQQCSEAIPHSDDFAHSNVSDCLLIGVLGSLETLCNSEQLRFVVYGFPKLNCKGRPHFVSRVMTIKDGLVLSLGLERVPGANVFMSLRNTETAL